MGNLRFRGFLTAEITQPTQQRDRARSRWAHWAGCLGHHGQRLLSSGLQPQGAPLPIFSRLVIWFYLFARTLGFLCSLCPPPPTELDFSERTGAQALFLMKVITVMIENIHESYSTFQKWCRGCMLRWMGGEIIDFQGAFTSQGHFDACQEPIHSLSPQSFTLTTLMSSSHFFPCPIRKHLAYV